MMADVTLEVLLFDFVVLQAGSNDILRAVLRKLNA